MTGIVMTNTRATSMDLSPSTSSANNHHLSNTTSDHKQADSHSTTTPTTTPVPRRGSIVGSSSVTLDESIKFHARDFLTHKQQDLLCDYELGDVLGEGGFGLVYSCIHRATGAERAVKIIRKDGSRPDYNSNIINEYNILKELDHPNLVKVYDLYQDEEAFFIVTDLYGGGDVFDVLEEQGPLAEDDAAIVMNNLLACVNYCHAKKKLVHRDLKPENILLDTTRDYSDIKVIDFGLARYVDSLDQKLTGLVGSAYYIAPQVIEPGEYTHKCDVWSCGVIAYALLSGYAPFDASTDDMVLEVVLDGRFDFDDPEWDDISEVAKDFIAQLLTYDEDDRPTAEQALQHPWLKQCRSSPRMNNALIRSASRSSLQNLQQFTSKSNKLKQAACAMIASQLLKKEEKEIIDKAFRALDKTCNGEITKEDLNSSMSDLFRDDDDDSTISSDNNGNHSSSHHEDDDNNDSYNSRAALVDNIFEQVNFSGSGAIQYSEFAIVTMLEKNMVDDVKLKAAFTFFDLDNKGHISKDDLKTVMKVGNHGAKRILEQTADPGSEIITFENFKKCILPERKSKESNKDNAAADNNDKSVDNMSGGRRGLLGIGRRGGIPLGGSLDDDSSRPTQTTTSAANSHTSRRRSSKWDESPSACRTHSRRLDSMNESSSRRQPLSKTTHKSTGPSIGRMSITAATAPSFEKLRCLEEWGDDEAPAF